jgi:SAM-dependent methyltransferase
VEVGIGGGQATRPILETGCTVTAVEPGEAFCTLCREKFAAYPNFSVINGKFEDVAFPEASCDLVYSASAFHWVPEEIGYRKAFGMLKSGGVFARFANHPWRDKGNPDLAAALDEAYAKYYHTYYCSVPKLEDEYTEAQAIRRAEIAAKYGYSTLDFRKPSADRIKSEERRVVLRGGTSWKEELREVIAEALKLCNNMDEFEKHLSKYGVTIARNTAKTISFMHPNKKKPIRGNKLGKAYTKEAIIHEFTESRNRRVRAATGTSKSTATAIAGENSGGNSYRVCPTRHRRYEEDERKRRQAYDEQRTAQAKPRKRIR